jgi:glutamate-1-semialdehyde 2,1-aminomutase
MRHERSKKLFARAQELIPGGVNSPVRAFRAVGTDPLFIARGEGAHLFDVDGNRYIDYVGSWGPLILGHAAPPLVEALSHAIRDGTSFGATTPREVELAERVTTAVPSVERIRFVSSGTEATMSALRTARGFTGRHRVIKFAGCYHGHADAFLVAETGSGLATLGIPGSAGVPPGATVDTISVPFNDLEAVRRVVAEMGPTLAAIIVEPIACNMGMVRPVPEFLPGLRAVCDEVGALLIFDEVITGFRVGLGGAQELFGVRPDLTTFGKIIGGGLPVGAYGGRADVMGKVAPLGPVYQAGTLSGNPLAMAAGIATLEAISQPGFYEQLERHAATFERGVLEVLKKHDRPALFVRQGSIFYLWFKRGAEAPPRNYDDIKSADSAAYAEMFRKLLAQGIAFAPSAFEVGFISAAHQQNHLDATIHMLDRALSPE